MARDDVFVHGGFVLTMNPLIVFVVTFAQVFFIGLQQMNVHHGRKCAAFATSLCIGGCQLASAIIVVRNGGIPDSLAYLVGGPLGIVASMTFFGNRLEDA